MKLKEAYKLNVSVTHPIKSVTDYGAIGDGITDDTEAFQKAVDAGPNIKIIVPTGVYLITSTITISKMSVFLEGEEGINSELRFVPTSADTMFHVQAPSGGVYFRGGMQNLFFSSSDFTHVKTGLLLEDVSEYRLRGLTCHDSAFSTGWSNTSTKESTFLHTTGRELLSAQDCMILADLPILIDQNPNTPRNSTLDADHFNFHNLYLICTVGTAMPCVRIANGVNLSDVSFSGYQAWVRPGGHGLEWIDTTNDGIASLNLTLDGIGLEQAQGSPTTDYSLYISKTGTNGLQGLNMRNFGGAIEINGVYLRNVNRSIFDQGYIVSAGSYSGQVVLDADGTCDDIISRDCIWQGNSTDSVATTTGLILMSGGKKTTVASPLPENFHLVKAATDAEDQQGIREFEGQKITRKISLDDAGTYNVSSVGEAELAMVQIVARGTGVSEAGIFSSDSNATALIAGTSNIQVASGAGKLSFSRSSDGGGAIDVLQNDTGVTLTIMIAVNKTQYDALI